MKFNGDIHIYKLYISAYIYIYIYIYIYVYIYLHIILYIQLYIPLHNCKYIHDYDNNIFINIQNNIYIYIYIYIYIFQYKLFILFLFIIKYAPKNYTELTKINKYVYIYDYTHRKTKFYCSSEQTGYLEKTDTADTIGERTQKQFLDNTLKRPISRKKWFIESFSTFNKTNFRFDNAKFISLVKPLILNNNTRTTSFSLIFRISK